MEGACVSCGFLFWRQGHFWSSVRSRRGHLDLWRTGYELQTRLSQVDCSQGSIIPLRLGFVPRRPTTRTHAPFLPPHICTRTQVSTRAYVRVQCVCVYPGPFWSYTHVLHAIQCGWARLFVCRKVPHSIRTAHARCTRTCPQGACAAHAPDLPPRNKP